jgi:hypothetical protein
MKLACGAAMAMSQAMATDAPAPAATPFTAATMGMRKDWMRRVVGLKAWSMMGPGSARATRSGPGVKSKDDKSAPAQKPRPAPVSTMARIWGVGFGLVKSRPQIVVHLTVKTVQRSRPVERDHRHRAVLFIQNSGC